MRQGNPCRVIRRITDADRENTKSGIVRRSIMTEREKMLNGGNGMTLLTPVHPLLAKERNVRMAPDGHHYMIETCRPVTVEDNVWLGGDVTILPGVTIGHDSVIGAGSVVTKSIPPGVVAAGNPCRIIRKITENDANNI